MTEQNEISDRDKFGDILLSAVEAVYPRQTEDDNFKQRVLSGDPEMVRGRCGYGASVDIARMMSSNVHEEVFKATSSHKENNGHTYLLIPDKDLILDATAGQFIPETSRVGFEKFFKGNMFIGSRTVLKNICLNGVIHTRTYNDPILSFYRIWGDESIAYA